MKFEMLRDFVKQIKNKAKNLGIFTFLHLKCDCEVYRKKWLKLEKDSRGDFELIYELKPSGSLILV